jgi:hypothetical protein
VTLCVHGTAWGSECRGCEPIGRGEELEQLKIDGIDWSKGVKCIPVVNSAPHVETFVSVPLERFNKLQSDSAELAELKAATSKHGVVPAWVHECGWQWRPVSPDGAFAPPFGTIRQCRGCGCLVAGGPTACVRCAEEKT